LDNYNLIRMKQTALYIFILFLTTKSTKVFKSQPRTKSKHKYHIHVLPFQKVKKEGIEKETF